MPITLKMAASSGIAMTPPRNRGTTTRWIGIDRHHFHRRQLVGGAHQSQLRGQRRARAAGEQQRGHHRTQLLDQADGRGSAQRLLGAETLQQLKTLQTEHHADEQSGEHDDDQRQRAGVENLLRRSRSNRSSARGE